MCISTGNFDSIYFLGVTSFLNLEIWPKWKLLLKQFVVRQSVCQSVSQSVSQSVNPVFLVSAAPLKLLNRISLNFVAMKDIMCRCAYPQQILIPFFFSELRPFLNFENWQKWKILLKQLVSTTPLKPLNRIEWNFVVMKDIMCRLHFYRKCWLILLRSNLYPLFCPISRP